MKGRCVVLGLFVLCGLVAAQSWAVRYNGTAGGADQASGLAVDGSGNVYVTGFSAGTGSGADYVTIKYNPAGQVLWTRRLSSAGAADDKPAGIALAPTGHPCVTGFSTGANTDYLTVKYNPASGETLWARLYDGPAGGDDEAAAIAVDNQGAVCVTGAAAVGTHREAVTVRYGAGGGLDWVCRVEPGAGDTATTAGAVAVDAGRNVYVCGRFRRNDGTDDYLTAKLTPLGETAWVRRYDGTGGSDFARAVAVDGAGNVYVTGSSWGAGTEFDIVTVKYSAGGVQQWAARHDGPDHRMDEAFDLAVDAGGNAWVTGYCTRPTQWEDYVTVKYTPAGETAWVRRTGSSGSREDEALALALDASGSVYVTGHSESPNDGDDVLTVKYDASGNLKWSVRYNYEPDDDDDWGVAVVPSGSGAVYVAGFSYATAGQDDFLTLKYLEHDFAVDAILSPRPDTTIPPQPLAPQARIRNRGLLADSGVVYLRVYLGTTLVHSDSKPTGAVGAGGTADIVFAPFMADAGTYSLRCSTHLAGDGNTGDNVASAGFTVRWTTLPAWTPKPNMLPGPSLKAAKDGGALCYGRYSRDRFAVFALKGANTNEFLRYHVSGDSWHQLESLPCEPGRKRRVKKGGALCYDRYDTLVFALKGNSYEFWKYHANLDSWAQCESVPLGPRRKKVKGGAGLAFFHARSDSDIVFCLKGGKTTEFYGYHVQSRTWSAKDTLPRGPKGKGMGDGSCLVNAAGTLYALQGTYNKLYAYEPEDDSWHERESLPRVGRAGRSKKAKMGTALCYGNGIIYALKGGTCEFWAYYPLADTWVELDSMPRLPSSRPVKGGGALVFGNGYVWALKGNKTFEFWQYYPGADDDGLPAPQASVLKAQAEGAQAQVQAQALRMAILPNPIASGFATLRLTRPLDHSSARPLLHVRVFDAAGRCVFHQSTIGNRTSTMTLDLRRLSGGVYPVRVDAGGFTATQKLVVQR